MAPRKAHVRAQEAPTKQVWQKRSCRERAGLALDRSLVLCGKRMIPGEQGLMHKDLWFSRRCGWGCVEGEKRERSPGLAAFYRP